MRKRPASSLVLALFFCAASGAAQDYLKSMPGHARYEKMRGIPSAVKLGPDGDLESTERRSPRRTASCIGMISPRAGPWTPDGPGEAPRRVVLAGPSAGGNGTARSRRTRSSRPSIATGTSG
jgi:hypothetical protein